MGKKVPDENGLKKGAWTAEEDQKLIDHIKKHGHRRWRTVALNAGLKRCGKSCRLRWTNYLRPDIKRGGFSFEEEETIIQLHRILGNKWSTIAAYLSGRTDNEIKNYWHSRIKKKLFRMGIDPVTHGPRLINAQELYSFLNSIHQRLNIQHLLQIDSETNRNLLNLVTSLALPHSKSPQGYFQQILHNDQLSNPQLIQNQVETLQSNNFLGSTTSNVPSLKDTFLMQAEMEQFSPSLKNSSSKNSIPNISCCNNNDNSTSHFGQCLVSPPELGHFGFGSGTSTPSSSSIHLNSSSTVYVNGSAEDELDTFCFPYDLDFDGFM